VERALKKRQVLEIRAPWKNDSSHNKNISKRICLQNSEKIYKEQREQSLGVQRLARKRSLVNDNIHSSSKKICLDIANSQNPATSSLTNRLKLVPGKMILLIIELVKFIFYLREKIISL